MTLVLDRTYPYTREGLGRYALNRALRIYPAYLVVLAVAAILVYSLPEVGSAMNPRLPLPATAQRWLTNIFLVGLIGDPWRPMMSQALVPQAWSLEIEVSFYVLMGLVLARHRLIVTLWFIASVAYTVDAVLTNAPFHARYSTLLGASLPFSSGAMLYMYRGSLDWLRPWTALISAPLFLGNVSLAAYQRIGSPQHLHCYLSLLFGALLVCALSRLKPGDVPDWFRRLDRIGGNLSYPIFLSHWNVGFVVVWLGFDGVRQKDSFVLWATTFLLTNLVAWALYVGIDRNADRIRDRVRKRTAARLLAHVRPGEG
jgi:peptidoglycan/LPS O-acetylase OafA/YrhL